MHIMFWFLFFLFVYHWLLCYVIHCFSGHSHFEVVIERLKQAQAEDSENDDPSNPIGEDDEGGVPTHDIKVCMTSLAFLILFYRLPIEIPYITA